MAAHGPQARADEDRARQEGARLEAQVHGEADAEGNGAGTALRARRALISVHRCESNPRSWVLSKGWTESHAHNAATPWAWGWRRTRGTAPTVSFPSCTPPSSAPCRR